MYCKFKDLDKGRYFSYEMFDNQFITGIKKTSKTALMLLDDKEEFIMYLGQNSKVFEKNITYIGFIWVLEIRLFFLCFINK